MQTSRKPTLCPFEYKRVITFVAHLHALPNRRSPRFFVGNKQKMNTSKFRYLRPERKVHVVVRPPVPNLADAAWRFGGHQIYSTWSGSRTGTGWTTLLNQYVVIGFTEKRDCQSLVDQLDTPCECVDGELRDVMRVAGEMLRMPLLVVIDDQNCFLRLPVPASASTDQR